MLYHRERGFSLQFNPFAAVFDFSRMHCQRRIRLKSNRISGVTQLWIALSCGDRDGLNMKYMSEGIFPDVCRCFDRLFRVNLRIFRRFWAFNFVAISQTHGPSTGLCIREQVLSHLGHSASGNEPEWHEEHLGAADDFLWVSYCRCCCSFCSMSLGCLFIDRKPSIA